MTELDDILNSLPENTKLRSANDILNELPMNPGSKPSPSAATGNRVPDVAGKYILSPENPFTGHLFRGIGTAMKGINDTVTELGRPSYKSPDQWKNEQTGISKAISNTGEAIQKQHDNNFGKEYEPYSVDWYAANIGEMLPTSVGLGAAGMAALRSGNPQAINQGATNIATRLGAGAKAAKWVGEGTGAGYVGTIAAYPEAALESNEVFNEEYETAKKEGLSDADAMARANKAKNFTMAANMFLLGGTNTVELLAGVGKLPIEIPKSGVKRLMLNAGRIGVAAESEGQQESTQAMIAKAAQNKPWSYNDEDVAQARSLGRVAGALFGGTGRVGEALKSRSEKNANDILNSLPENRASESQTPSRPAPIADGIEDGGLKNTSGSLVGAVNELNNWAYGNFGKDLIVSGGWRSEQHNAEVNGSPTSHHLHGNALDIDASQFSAEELEAIKAKATEMGFNSDGEDMYHDRGSGYHLHLTLPGGKVNGTSAVASQVIPVSAPIQYTSEETQQAVTWLEDKIPDLQVDNIEQANYVESELAKKNVEKLLADYKVKDDNGQEVSLGQHLFPDKFQQQSVTVNEQQPAKPNAIITSTPIDTVSRAQAEDAASLMASPAPGLVMKQTPLAIKQELDVFKNAVQQHRDINKRAMEMQGIKFSHGQDTNTKGSEPEYMRVVDEGLKLKSPYQFAKLEQIGEPDAAIYRQKTGLDLVGYRHEITSDEVRHASKHMAQSEVKQGQIPLTRDDFRLIPEVTRPANIIAVEQGKRNQNIIKYEKPVNGHLLIVEEVLTGRQTLRFLTMRKTKRPSARVVPDDSSPPPTSVSGISPVNPERNLVSSDSSISVESGKVNTGDNPLLNGQKLQLSTNNPTGQFRPFSFGQEPQYGITHEIPLGDGTIERFRFIPEKSYKKDEQAISELGQYMGVPVRFFIARRELRGFHDPDTGISYINRNGNRGIEWAFWHENLHWMKEQDPALYRDLLTHVQDSGAITPEQIAEYRQTIAQGDTLTDIEAIEEMLADEFADNAKRQAWAQQLQQRDTGLFERFVEWIKSVISQMKSHVGENSKLTKGQVKAFENAARKTLLSLKDKNGNRLFQDRTEFPYQELLAEAVQFSSSANQENIESFVDDALASGKTRRHLPLFEVSEAEAARIQEITGVDVSGFRHVLSNQDLRHAIKQHGDATRESARGQIAITEKDLKTIPQVLKSYDYIVPGGQNAEGPSVRYIKQTNGHTVIAEVVIPDRKTLLVKTIWKKPTAYIMPNKTSPQYTSTPERSAKTSSNTTSIVQQSGKDVNDNHPDNSINEKKSTARHRASNADPLHTSTSVSTLTPGGGLTSSNESARLRSRGLQLPKEVAQQQDSDNSITQQGQKDVKETISNEDNSKKEVKFSADAIGEIDNSNKIRYSAGPKGNHIWSLSELLKSLGFKVNSNAEVINRVIEGVNPTRLLLQSPSRLAELSPKIKAFVFQTIHAHKKIDQLRERADHQLGKIGKLLADKDDMDDFQGVMLMGDLNQEEYTTQELRNEGYSDKVIRAYKMARKLLDQFYEIANDIHQRTQTISKRATKAELQEIKDSPFTEIISEKPLDNGDTLVTYKERNNRLREDVPVDGDALVLMAQDPNIQIVRVRNATGAILNDYSTLVHGDNKLLVTFKEQTPPINKLEGHIRHFFGDWMVYEKVKDADGNEQLVSVESANSRREAIVKVNKLDPGKTYLIKPKTIEIPNANQYATVVGDREFFRIMQKLEEEFQVTPGEAQQILDGKVSMKARGRFYGGKMHRTGAQGYETDVFKVMRRQTYEIARFAALDPWKREMISRYERLYGRWDDWAKHSVEAMYIHKYISDVNGDISILEKVLNRIIEGIPGLSSVLDTYGINRPAVALGSTVMKWTAVAKLGFRVKTALVNFAQAINSAGAMNDWEAMISGLRRASGKVSISDQKVLIQSGVGADIGVSDIGAGYSQARRFSNRFVNGAMWLFSATEKRVRAGTILGAYHKARQEGQSHGEALQYAEKINQKANGNYAISDTPLFIRAGGPVTQTAAQFMKYPIKQLEIIGEILFGKGNLLNPMTWRPNAGQNTRFWLPYLALSGGWGIPGFKVLMLPVVAGILRAFGYDGDDDELLVKQATFKMANEFFKDIPEVNELMRGVVRIGWYGVLGAVPKYGVDVSKSTGIGDFGSADNMPRNAWERFFSAFGPGGSTIYNTTIKVADGDTLGALNAISPAIGDMAAAIAGEKRGKRGRLQTTYDTMYERILKVAGFRLVDEAEESDIGRIEKDILKSKRDEVAVAIDNYLEAEANKDQKAITKAAEELRRLKVTGKQVAGERRRKNQTALERTEKTIPKKYRQEFDGIMGFK